MSGNPLWHDAYKDKEFPEQPEENEFPKAYIRNGRFLNIDLGYEITSPRLVRIMTGPMADAARLFVKRNLEYGDESAYYLGVKGQFADINRKFRKLKRLMWDQSVPEDLITESTEEVLMDFIGHSILSINMLREEEEDGEKGE